MKFFLKGNLFFIKQKFTNEKKSKIKRECPFSLFHENVGIIADDWSNRQKVQKNVKQRQENVP